MVTVKLGTKTEEKPFPKLMRDNEGDIVYFMRSGYGLPIWNLNNFCGPEEIVYDDWTMEDFTDYNEPVTLQNA